MNQRLQLLAQWALMVIVSACLFVGFFQLNGWALAPFEYTPGVNWVFLPAGFRVLLVLILGLPGALGIVAGNLWLDHEQWMTGHAAPYFLAALVSGMGPWAVRQWMVARGLLDKQLKDITLVRLVNFILVYAAVNAVFHQFIRWNFQISHSVPWVDIWPMFIGDVVGALAVLYVFKISLPWLKAWARKRI